MDNDATTHRFVIAGWCRQLSIHAENPRIPLAALRQHIEQLYNAYAAGVQRELGIAQAQSLPKAVPVSVPQPAAPSAQPRKRRQRSDKGKPRKPRTNGQHPPAGEAVVYDTFGATP